MRGTWPSINQRQFAEMIPYPEHTKNDLAAIFRHEHNFHLAGADHVECVTRVALADNDRALAVLVLARDIGEGAQRRALQLPE